MRLVAIGLNHRTAPVTLRERFAVPAQQLSERLISGRVALAAEELAILSTCNRTEWYVATHDPAAVAEGLMEWMAPFGRLSGPELARICYQFVDEQAADHLFRVAAGLDSMILGESEITAQVKHAYAMAHAANTAGALLHRLFQKALHTAKLIRSKTAIASGQASVGSVVAGLAREWFAERLGACEVLLWGAGKAAEATTRHLVASGIGALWIVNRTQDKAQQLAALCQGGWVSWERARKQLASVDIAIVCTQAPHYVIDGDDLAAVMPARRGRALCLIDLAVPRNIDPSVAARPGVRLYNVDDLEALAGAGLSARRQELSTCRAIIDDQVRHFASRHTTDLNKESPAWECVGTPA